MKKIISLIMGVTMLFSFGCISFAKSETTNTTLSYVNDSNYEINIPANVSIDKSTGIGSMQVAVTDANLDVGDRIVVSIDSEDYTMIDDDNTSYAWFLANVKDPNTRLRYYLEDNEGDIVAWKEIINTTKEKSVDLNIRIVDDLKVGTYETVLTFTTEIKELQEYEIKNGLGSVKAKIDGNNLVTFEIDDEHMPITNIYYEFTEETIPYTKVADNTYTFTCTKPGDYRVPYMLNGTSPEFHMITIREFNIYEIKAVNEVDDISVRIDKDGLVTIQSSIWKTSSANQIDPETDSYIDAMEVTTVNSTTTTFQSNGIGLYAIDVSTPDDLKRYDVIISNR